MRDIIAHRIAGFLLALEGIGLLILVGWQVVALVGGDTGILSTALALLVLTLAGAAIVLAFAGATWRRVSWGRSGGIVTQPTLAMIGEAGPEAVIPLSRTPGSSPLPGGGTTFIINVSAGMGTDGHQVGNQIVSALKQWERSNGSLPLTVSAA